MSDLLNIFRRPAYLILAAASSLSFLLFSLWLSNLDLLRIILGSPRLTMLEKITFFLNILGTLKMSPEPISSFSTVLVSILFGLNLSLFVFYFRMKQAVLGPISSLGLSGFLLGILGVGCASCGSVIFSVLGLTTIAAFLPLKGVEFNLMASLLLIISTKKLLGIIRQGYLCPIPSK